MLRIKCCGSLHWLVCFKAERSLYDYLLKIFMDKMNGEKIDLYSDNRNCLDKSHMFGAFRAKILSL